MKLGLFFIMMGTGVAMGRSHKNTTALLSSIFDEQENPQTMPRPKRVFDPVTLGVGVASALAGLASGAIGLASPTYTDKSHKGVNRNVEIKVENLLEWPLLAPKSFTWKGYISSSPTSIRPCEIGVVAGHKKRHRASGTKGIVSWRIEKMDVTVSVYWKVPFVGCNKLSLGLINGQLNAGNTYKEKKDFYGNLYSSMEFQEFCQHTEQICIEKHGIWVCGTMSTSGAAEIEIVIGSVENAMFCAKEVTGILPGIKP